VEATKFTEVGYVGRDVDSMIRDLMELAVNMAKKEEQEKVKSKAGKWLKKGFWTCPSQRREEVREPEEGDKEKLLEVVKADKSEIESTREKLRRLLRAENWTAVTWSWKWQTRAFPWSRFSPIREWKKWNSYQGSLWEHFPVQEKKRRVELQRPWRSFFRKSPRNSLIWITSSKKLFE